MELRNLGNSGLRISELCLGAMTFGREADEATSFALLDAFSNAGGNFIDNANVYNAGLSEEILGKWLKNKARENYIIATKVRFPMGSGANSSGLGRVHIRSEVENSLRRLQCDYIDLYQVHCWDPNTPLEETLSTLNDLVREGKVRHIGASNFKPSQLQKALDISRSNSWASFVSLQPLYNLLDRYIEWELQELCLNEGLGILPWSPLRGGWLSGKFRREDSGPQNNTRVHDAQEHGWFESWSNYANERTWKILETLAQVAQNNGKTSAQVALNWVNNRPGVSAAIIGARNLEQLNDNLGAANWSLSAEEVKLLDDTSYMEPPYYPYGFINWACNLKRV